MKDKEKKINISEEGDIAVAVYQARILAKALGFAQTPQCMIETAVSELATNIYNHAGRGEIVIRTIKKKGKKGIEVVAKDQGSGIEDIERAMREGFSTSGSLGLGLSGIKRLMDEFIIDSKRKRGTKITVRKWL